MNPYETAGTEPSFEEVMNDPIVRLLRLYDGLLPPESPECGSEDTDWLPRAA